MKIKLDALINLHYNYLLNLSNKITQKHKSKDPDIKYTLLHECITKVYDTIETKYSFTDDDTSFKKYMNKFMNQHYHWQRSRIRDTCRDNDLFTFRDVDFNNDDNEYEQKEISDLNESNDLILLNAENVNDITKLYLKDLIVNDIPIERGLMYSRIDEIVKTFNYEEQELFNLFFIQEIKVLEVYKKLRNKLKKQTIGYNDLLKKKKNLKEKIKKQLENDSN